MHKTGSTSIQDTLAKNNCGDEYTYLDLGEINHNHRIYSLFSENPINYYLNKGKPSSKIEQFNKETKELLDQCIRELKTPNAIISGEDLINLNETELSNMNSFFQFYFEDVLIFAYVREPVAYMNSLLQQVIKSGVGFERFLLENNLEKLETLNLSMLYPEYRKTFLKYEKVFGKKNLQLKLFDKNKLIENNVVIDFIKNFNLPITKDQIITSNEGISKPALSILYALRKATLNGEINLTPQLLNRIANKLHSIQGLKLLLSNNIYEKLLIDNIDDIKWLEQKLLQNLPISNPDNNGVSNEYELMKISEQEFLEFSELIDTLSLEERFKNKIFDMVKNMCLHGDIKTIFTQVSENFHFLNLNNTIKPNYETADILREVAFAFERSSDIQTAYKVMEQAHYLRPKGPTIKQKLEEYRQKLAEQQNME